MKQAVLPALFHAWGGRDRTRRPYAADIELTRVALDCGDLDVLVATAADAIRGQEETFAYREAAATATAALAALIAGERPQDAGLLRAAAEAFDRVGDAVALQLVYAAAPSLAADDPALLEPERIARAQFRSCFAGWLAQQGEPDRALTELRAAEAVFVALGDRGSRAVTLGDIARIMTAKGEVDAALELHKEKLQIVEALGDRWSRAVTLGFIARIMTAKGEVDAALALHKEKLQIVVALGDRRSRAVTVGDIARIMTNNGEVDAALELHKERLETYRALGDRREHAVTLGDIARIMTTKGEVDAALELQRERLRTNEALGDRDGIAATKYDIGQILLAQAIEHRDAEAFRQAHAALAESYQINLKIGQLEGICVVGATLGQVLAMSEQREEAKTVLTRSRDGFRKLGRMQESAKVEELLRRLG